jgi:hypothetical protein
MHLYMYDTYGRIKLHMCVLFYSYIWIHVIKSYIRIYIPNGSFSVDAPATYIHIYLYIHVFSYITNMNIHIYKYINNVYEFMYIYVFHIYRMVVFQWMLRLQVLGADCPDKYRIRVSWVLEGRWSPISGGLGLGC